MNKDEMITEEYQEQKEQRESNGVQERELIFKDKLKELQRVLDAEDIDFRIGRSGLKKVENGKEFAWCTLLAYKDARVDMKRLDEVFGGEWKNTFHRDSKGVLQCEISIYNHDLCQWVSRASNGIASNFEAEKGEYSDAFKRAGFMWGIGRELYDMPDLYVKLNDDEFWVKDSNDRNPKVNPTHLFQPNSWEWKVDWNHVDTHKRRTGLIWAKGKGSSNYRIKPTSLIEHHKAEVVK